MPHQDQPEEILAPSRRHVLRGVAAAGAVAIGGGLVACGSDDTGNGGSTGTTAPATTPGTTSPDGSASPSATGSEAPSDALARTTDIPVGSGQVFDDARVVVTQPSAGEFKAFSAICTHQGCTVASVGDGLITCPCHGSQYSIEDGSVQRGPATAALAARNVSVDDGDIVVT